MDSRALSSGSRAVAKINHLLAALAPDEYTVLISKFRRVPLEIGDRLSEADTVVTTVYFPVDCMVSLLPAGTAAAIELASIGNEGVVGGSEALLNRPALGAQVVQIPGAALEMEAETFREAVTTLPNIASLLQRHFYALTRQILQSAVCSHRHTMEQRCARWLLMAHDRAGQETFPLTQELLSRMLGVRRATVNAAIANLKEAGVVRYVRGQVTVSDRTGLEAAACECYKLIVRQYEMILTTGTAPL